MARARAIDTRLEKLIPHTDELFVAGVLTKEEIKQLVKDRTFHEYKLVARPLLFVDVKNAINFELALEGKISNFCAEFNRQAALEAQGGGVDENGKKIKKKSGAPPKKLQLKHRWAVQERIESIYKIGLKHLFSQRKTASLLQLKRKATLTTAPLTGFSRQSSAATTAAGNASTVTGHATRKAAAAAARKAAAAATDDITADLTNAAAAHQSKNNAAAAAMDDYEVLRRECVQQLKAFGRQASLSRMYAEWLTRSPQDAFLWSEAALFEAVNGRNDEARAIIQQALATLRQTSSSGSTSTIGGSDKQVTSAVSIRLAGKDFTRQKASEEAKEVFGTALLIEIIFAKKLLEGAIEAAVRKGDKKPAESLRGENAALAAIVLDMALAEAVVADSASSASAADDADTKQITPFLCPDLGLYLYSIAVCHQFTASLCRSILLQTLSVAATYGGSNKGNMSSVVSSSASSSSPLSALLTELFLTDVRFAALNCVSAQRFLTEKTLGDLALLSKKVNGEELQREWVVRNLHRKHRVVTIKEKKEKVVASVGAALTLIISVQSAEEALNRLDKTALSAIVAAAQKEHGEAQRDDDSDDAAEKTSTSLLTALLRTIVASSASAALAYSSASNADTAAKKQRGGSVAAAVTTGAFSFSALAGLRAALSDAITQLMCLSRDLVPIHMDDAQEALAAYEETVRAEKEAKKAQKEKEKKRLLRQKKAAGEENDANDDEEKEEEEEDFMEQDPNKFLTATANAVFLFSQAESSKILRTILLLETSTSASLSTKEGKPLAIVAAINKAVSAAVGTSTATSFADDRKEAAAVLELYRELALAGSLLTPFASDAATTTTTESASGSKKAGGKKAKKEEAKTLSEQDAEIERANRRTIVTIGRIGTSLLKNFVVVAFAAADETAASLMVSQHSYDISAASTDDSLVGLTEGGEDAFDEDVSPLPSAGGAGDCDLVSADAYKTAFGRGQLWWGGASATSSSCGGLLDTRFLSTHMLAEDLVLFLHVAQSPALAATSTSTDSKKAQPHALATLTTREDVAMHISRVLALIDNEAALHDEEMKKKKTAAPAKKDPVIPKLIAAIQLLVCTPHTTTAASRVATASPSTVAVSSGAYLPYEPSLWRLFTALQHSLNSKITADIAAMHAAAVDVPAATSSSSPSSAKLTSSSSLLVAGSKTARDNDDDDSDDEDQRKNRLPKKKLRIGNNGSTASSSASGPATTAAAATSVISQREDLNSVLSDILAILNAEGAATPSPSPSPCSASTFELVSLSRRLFRLAVQIVAGGSSHASLPTSELRVERLQGIMAITTVELIREMETVAIQLSTAQPHLQQCPPRLTFNASPIFLAVQVLHFQQLVSKISAATNAEPAVQAFLCQCMRVHNLLLAPVRIPELTDASSAAEAIDSLAHGYCTPLTRALIRSVLIPCFAAAHTALSAPSSSSSAAGAGGLIKAKKPIVTATEKAIHSLLAQLTALYTVEVKEAGKFGNGVRNSQQYATIQVKEVADHIIQSRSEAFLPFFFGGDVATGGLAFGPAPAAGASSVALTKQFIVNAQVNDWLLALAFEQQYTKNLTEAMAVHSRAVQSVEAPQTFLAAVSAGTLPALF